jgi:hypothetical protein
MTSLTYRLYIDGTWQDSQGDAVLTVLNPATEEVPRLEPAHRLRGYLQSGLSLERGEYGLK